MQQQQPNRFRRFVQTPPGKALLLALTLLVVFATFVYVEALVAIPAMLLFGLAIPIWLGLKAPRYLALSGLVILLILAPISNLVITQQVMTPIPASASSNVGPDGSNGSVLQGALVSPYVGGTSTNFTWNVTVYPQYIPAHNSSPLWLNLYISNCPGATVNDLSRCSPPYPFTELNVSWNNTTAVGVTGERNASFHWTIGTLGIWDWQMSVTVRNNVSDGLYYIFLVGDPTYNGIEGPVIGTYDTTYSSLLLALYLEDFLYLGGPFYFVLLIYMIFKRREKTKAEAARRLAGPTPADETGPSLPAPVRAAGPAPPSATTRASPKEGSCPSCGAVVYAGEKTCWKCGATLGSGSSGAPLQSSGKT